MHRAVARVVEGAKRQLLKERLASFGSAGRGEAFGTALVGRGD